MNKITDKTITLIPSGNDFIRCEIDVPFVPTPLNIVDEMLAMAHVGKNDTVYDLGCGDGRIAITAAKKCGARAVGIDLDPRRIKESRDNAKKAGLNENISFLNQSFFKSDIKNATVVTLYLLSNVNIKLRAKLLDELQPGTRIVSHDFHMEKWRAEKRIEKGNHTLFFWTIPANISGIWHGKIPKTYGGFNFSMKIKQHFQETIAEFISPEKSPVKRCKIKGNTVEIRMKLLIDKQSRPVRFTGKINDDIINGTMTTIGRPEEKWRCVREAFTVKPLY